MLRLQLNIFCKSYFDEYPVFEKQNKYNMVNIRPMLRFIRSL